MKNKLQCRNTDSTIQTIKHSFEINRKNKIHFMCGNEIYHFYLKMSTFGDWNFKYTKVSKHLSLQFLFTKCFIFPEIDIVYVSIYI